MSQCLSLSQVSFDFLTSLLRVIKESWQESDSDNTQALLALLKKASTTTPPRNANPTSPPENTLVSPTSVHAFRNEPATSETVFGFCCCLQAYGESICHCLQKYCLNYSAAILYLDSLKPREDFGSYVKVFTCRLLEAVN